MSALRDRLKRLKSSQTNLASEQTDSRAVQTAHQMSPLNENAWSAVDCVQVENDYGTYMKRERKYPFEYKHGMYALGDLERHAGSLQTFHPASRVELRKLLFFDTETTGLGLGAGNVPFMLGIGHFEADSFVLQQMLIRNPAEEYAMLQDLKAHFERFSHLVSYNGRAFDWSLVMNRFVMHRLPLNSNAFVHLDYLYASRSLWKHSLPSCRLGVVEEQKLGIERVDDLPGAMAPSLYFQFLNDQQPETIRKVFEHNEIDILTLVSLSTYFAQVLAGHYDTDHMTCDDQFRLALWLDKMGMTLAAEGLMDDIIQKDRHQDYYAEMGQWFKKQGQLEKAVDLWAACTKHERYVKWGSIEPWTELAMYYEHKVKDYHTALIYTDQAIELNRSRAALTRDNSKHRQLQEQLIKRSERLKRKLTKRSQPKVFKAAAGNNLTH